MRERVNDLYLVELAAFLATVLRILIGQSKRLQTRCRLILCIESIIDQSIYERGFTDMTWTHDTNLEVCLVFLSHFH